MAIENKPSGEIDLEIIEDLPEDAPQPDLGMEVELPEEMNIQGDLTSSFPVTIAMYLNQLHQLFQLGSFDVQS